MLRLKGLRLHPHAHPRPPAHAASAAAADGGASAKTAPSIYVGLQAAAPPSVAPSSLASRLGRQPPP